MAIQVKELKVKTPTREILLDITRDVDRVVRSSGVAEGTCHVFVPHTTAGVTINENADPAVKEDIVEILGALVPVKQTYKHAEGNSDAHVKASLVGFTSTLLIHEGRIVLGTWQGIMFCEFDGPRTRRVVVQVQGE
ncbi:MAG: secondary thiamine-phosphate synthase enzyme YjbQ [Promethearchaeota archaeon]